MSLLKKDKKVTTTIRLLETVRDQLREMGKANRITMSQMITNALNEAMKNEKRSK